MDDYFTNIEEWKKKSQKLGKINEIESKKKTFCKYCKKPVKFVAYNISIDPFSKKEKIHWRCQSIKTGENHSSLCLGSPNYKPKFVKGDTIFSKWKEHSTIYIVGSIDEEEGYYNLIYQKKRKNTNRIPIKTIDKKSNKCDNEMVEAIFG